MSYETILLIVASWVIFFSLVAVVYVIYVDSNA